MLCLLRNSSFRSCRRAKNVAVALRMSKTCSFENMFHCFSSESFVETCCVYLRFAMLLGNVACERERVWEGVKESSLSMQSSFVLFPFLSFWKYFILASWLYPPGQDTTTLFHFMEFNIFKVLFTWLLLVGVDRCQLFNYYLKGLNYLMKVVFFYHDCFWLLGYYSFPFLIAECN